MKTPLTFLLSLTFLFLFSGSIYGGVIDETIDGVFDRNDEKKQIN